jgi:hypothetical protein
MTTCLFNLFTYYSYPDVMCAEHIKMEKKYFHIKKKISPRQINICGTHTLEIKKYVLPCYDDRHAGNETLSVEEKTLHKSVCTDFPFSTTSDGLMKMRVCVCTGLPARQQMLFFPFFFYLSLSPSLSLLSTYILFAVVVILIIIINNAYPPRTNDEYL